MAEDKKTDFVFKSDDTRAVILAWLKDSTSTPHNYITKEGMAYLNGFLQANNSIDLIKLEKYNELISKYEHLINKYERLKNNKFSFRKFFKF